MAWSYLIGAGLLEIVGVIGIKRVAEKNNFINNVILIGGFIISFSLLMKAIETIPLSTAYAVWTGIGTVGAAVVGMILFKESKSPLRMFCILGVIACVVGLKLTEA
ncbi:QacE family quaternary ammonium compound efflux SMR transporter [Paenibacillus sp. LMG 31460]|uniref:QacE family quaternary ammonium compound efflux SMR transporter n=1 Tax=Paenibacillus germinis TaxID=2654979 RepID=A0ABX1Z8X0_9BACL|nr:multidrug efflux SMR transporter [Paenibacillus germinis]NOU88366.1 QacE family quaternary ammonium compound efflux SMR transporter [Paenibacillus germinis]